MPRFDGAPSVAEREESIRAILIKDYYLDGEFTDEQTAVGDLLSDVLHFAARYNMNLHALFDHALMHFEGERSDENIADYDYIDCDPDETT